MTIALDFRSVCTLCTENVSLFYFRWFCQTHVNMVQPRYSLDGCIQRLLTVSLEDGEVNMK